MNFKQIQRHIARIFALLICLTVCPVFVFADDTNSLNGDVNGDGIVSAADAAIILRVLSGAYGDDAALSNQSDVSGNLAVSHSDAQALLMYTAGFADSLETITSTLNGSLLGDRYMDLFSYRGPIQTENVYRSDSVCVTRSLIRYKETNCYVADIYIRDVSALRTAFSSNKLNGRIQTVLKMAANHNAIIAINGDYYTNNNHKAILVRNGNTYYSGSSKNFDTCVLYKDGHMEVFSPKTKASEIEAKGEIWQTWTFGPSLIGEDGMAKIEFSCNKEICGINPRSVIGYYEPGHYCFVLADGRAGKVSRGLTMEDLAAFMAEELNCVLAYNFDGGQTAVMTTSDAVINSPFNGGRSSSDIVYICEPNNTAD